MKGIEAAQKLCGREEAAMELSEEREQISWSREISRLWDVRCKAERGMEKVAQVGLLGYL